MSAAKNHNHPSSPLRVNTQSLLQMWHWLTVNVKKKNIPLWDKANLMILPVQIPLLWWSPLWAGGRVRTNIRGFRKYETFGVVGNELRVVMRQRQRSNPSHINSDHTAVVRSRESLAITSSGKITFSKEWTVKNRGWCWARSKEYQLLINRSTPLMAIKHHVTAVLPQYVLHVSEQWQGNPRKVFSWPRGTGLRLFWAPVCS